ncbi:MAG: C-terminal binding protein [Alicyclobacillus sp.]|nr:C-terminal binding protein [Alicyclobacillus sp.]
MAAGRCLLLTDAERFPPGESARSLLAAVGITLIECPASASQEEFMDMCQSADGLLVFARPISFSVIDNLPARCKVIARCGTGYDNIDVAAARRRGIAVTYVPDYAVSEVADHTMALILDCVRRVSYSHARMRCGHWLSYPELRPIHRSSAMTLGLWGFGRIAQAVADRARAFGFKIIAHDPYVSGNAMLDRGVVPVTREHLLAESDVLSLHVPLTSKTVRMMDDVAFQMLQRKPYLVNTSRGGLVDVDALVRALEQERIAGAALDVLASEPIAQESPLLRDPRVTLTPHSAAFSEEALDEVIQRAVVDAIRVLNGEPPRNPVE